MAKLNLSEQLDRMVQALLARPADAPLRRQPKEHAQLQALARIAADLRDLPREDFKARLKVDLERRTSMGSKPVVATATRQTATAYLIFQDAGAAIEFYKQAFGAVEEMRLIGPGSKIGHAEIRIGNSKIYMADESREFGALSPQTVGGSPVTMHIVVDDVDAVTARAIAAGARQVRPVMDQFYGMRSGQVADPFGYVWNISTVTEEMTGAEMQKRYDDLVKQGAFTQPQPKSDEKQTPAVRPIPQGFHTLTPYLAVNDAARLIDFLKQAFGAVEVFRVPRPGSQLIMHAHLRIDDSVLELADATEEFGARQAGIILHVDDVDATYERAMKAGGTSVFAPVEEHWGDRDAAVKDTSQNQWIITEKRKTGHRTDDTRAILPVLVLRGVDEFIGFTKRAFGSEETFMLRSPEGQVIHARIRIGDSILALGELFGERVARPGALHMYVPDVDAVYAAAVREGVKVVRPLREESYGDRTASLMDAFGNWWFPSTHIKDVAF